MSIELHCDRCGKDWDDRDYVVGQDDHVIRICAACAGELAPLAVLAVQGEGHERPVAIDPEAESAEPDLPAFAAPPRGAPMYYGFPVLRDFEVEGFHFGMITDFRAQPTSEGDAFVVAPDDSRAGLVWEVTDSPYFEPFVPIEPERWGVWQVGFPYPMRTQDDIRRNLSLIVPQLRQQWVRWREGNYEEPYEDDRDAPTLRAHYDRAHAAGASIEAAQAAFDLGRLLESQGEIEGAKGAYHKAMASGVPELVAWATYRLGVMLEDESDPAAAESAYRYVMASAVRSAGGQAAINLGLLLEVGHDREGAKAAYRHAIQAGGGDAAAWGALNLAILLVEDGQKEEATALYEQTTGSGFPVPAGRAAVNLGLLLSEAGDSTGALEVWRQAVATAPGPEATIAESNIGSLLEELGETDAAMTALRHVLSSGEPEHSGRAGLDLARLLLTHRNDVDGAIAAFRQTVTIGLPEQEALALRGLASILNDLGRLDDADSALRRTQEVENRGLDPE